MKLNMSLAVPPDDKKNQHFWNAIFANPDPWSYDDQYERTKRAHTLEILPATHFARALEIGCAEGHFTVELAKIVETLVAVDISTTALCRAEERCRSLDNIRFEHLDIFRRVPCGTYDLIVCSEVLYYVKNRFCLDLVARRIASKLHPEGYLVLAHANSVTDNRQETGFDFHEIGASFIGCRFAHVRGLQFVRELRTDLYRIQLFKKSRRTAGSKCPTEVTNRKALVGTKDRASRLIKWGGCEVTDAESRYLWCSTDISILMYHRIADAGPKELAPYRVSPRDFERQLAYLRRHGFQSITIDQAFDFLHNESYPPRGRFVAFTFDDAYRDFYHCAWPLLKGYGFSATVFIPVSFVGQCAEWDRCYGQPAEIMSWDEIKIAHADGLVLASHSMTHRRLTDLQAEEARDELFASKSVLERELGTCVDIVSYPFGHADETVYKAAEACGYRYGVVGTGRMKRGDGAYRLPRQEVLGNHGMDQFIELLGEPRRPNVFTQLRYRWRHLFRDRRTYMAR